VAVVVEYHELTSFNSIILYKKVVFSIHFLIASSKLQSAIIEIASIGHRNCNSERMQYAGVELFASLSFVFCDLC